MATPGQLMFARRLGPTARLLIWLMVGMACVVLDTRYHALDGLRSGFSLLLQPVRESMRAPAMSPPNSTASSPAIAFCRRSATPCWPNARSWRSGSTRRTSWRAKTPNCVR